MSRLTKDYIEKNIPKLGFGIMRLPLLKGGSGAIDMEEFIKMTDLYMANGMNYFDTAYMYHDGESERAVKKAVVERYPRSSFTIATKLPIWMADTPADMERIFNEALCKRVQILFNPAGVYTPAGLDTFLDFPLYLYVVVSCIDSDN